MLSQLEAKLRLIDPVHLDHIFMSISGLDSVDLAEGFVPSDGAAASILTSLSSILR
jgi:hypothetical protein